MDPLVEELCGKIIRAVKLEGVSPSDIDPAAPLFGTGLGLDSIDGLELVVMLERDYGIVIGSTAVAETAFASVNALAKFVTENQASCKKEKPL
ncbi:MAG: phosphopantetheine-binding protein [bacterium]